MSTAPAVLARARVAVGLAIAFGWPGCAKQPARPVPPLGTPRAIDAAHSRLGAPPSGSIWAAAGKVDITPTAPAYLAGFSPGRKSTGVHDPLYARCLFLDDGRVPLALVTLDLVGFLHHDVLEVRRRLTERFPASVIVASTHVHAAPDTLGLWGPGFILPVGSGIDPDYMERVKSASAECVEQASAHAKPASAVFARTQAPSELSFNIHAEERADLAAAKDDDVTVARWIDAAGEGIATVVAWACHPEALGRENTLVTADFPGPLVARLEERWGGTGLFVNGAIGGLVTVHTPEQGPRDFELAAVVGTRIADVASAALESSERVAWAPVEAETFRAEARPLPIAFENGWWRFFRWLGLLEIELDPDGNAASEITAWHVGPSTWLTVPGEIFPSLGRRYKAKMASDFPFLIGLGNDELGYVMEASEFEDETYGYEQMMSPGKQSGPALSEAVERLLETLRERDAQRGTP